MKQVWTVIISVGISSLIAAMVYVSIPKTAFVDNQRLFDAFEGKKELENRLEQASNQRKAALDSLGLQIQSMQQLAATDEQAATRLQGMLQRYQQMSQEQEGYYQYKSQEYTEAIWKQISQYAIEYGESSGYDYVYGIAGTGSLMYGKPHYDITDEVIDYINKRYAGN